MSEHLPPSIDNSCQWLIVSDLDGTLLDHHSYSHAAADPLLEKLERLGIPVILNSSKTFDEMIELRKSLHNRHPFIVENGSAILIPAGYFPEKPANAVYRGEYWAIEPGSSRSQILQFLHADAQRFPRNYLNFADASIADIAAATGLSREETAKAKQRDYSEPLQWIDSQQQSQKDMQQQKQAFIARTEQAGFTTLQGGRFLHILGKTDKGAATKLLLDLWRQFSDRECRIIASGDGPNDLDMLQAADIALVVRSPAHPPPTIEGHPQLVISNDYGPAGWSESINEIVFSSSNCASRET